MNEQYETSQDRRHIISGLIGLALPTTFLASLPQSAFAQARVAQAGDTVTVTGQTPVVTLQTWVDLYGRPTANVMLNGRGPFKFVVDTGSNTSVVSTRVARLLEIPALPEKLVHGVTGTMMSRFGRVARIETGRSVSLNLVVAVLDAPAFETLDGVLGMDMFQNRRIRFNFTRKTVEFDPSRGRPRRLPVRVGVKLRQGLLIEADGRVGGVRAKCVLDTGCDTTIINTALLDAIRSPAVMRRRNAVPPQILGVTSQELNGVWVNLPNINLIGLEVRRLTAVSADPHIFNLWGLAQTPAMLVGMDILSQVETLVIDYGRREVELQLLSNLVDRTIGAYHG
jgi:Aspartyl protease/gag-polyprotein putative aspartyl protease